MHGSLRIAAVAVAPPGGSSGSFGRPVEQVASQSRGAINLSAEDPRRLVPLNEKMQLMTAVSNRSAPPPAAPEQPAPRAVVGPIKTHGLVPTTKTLKSSPSTFVKQSIIKRSDLSAMEFTRGGVFILFVTSV
jgi:hypothetical protein